MPPKHQHNYIMKKETIIKALYLGLLTTFSSCAVIGGIFKTGIGVGIFLTVLVIAIVIYVIFRFFKK